MIIGYISPFFAEIRLRAETDHQQTKANIAYKVFFQNVCGNLTSVQNVEEIYVHFCRVFKQLLFIA